MTFKNVRFQYPHTSFYKLIIASLYLISFIHTWLKGNLQIHENHLEVTLSMLSKYSKNVFLAIVHQCECSRSQPGLTYNRGMTL